MAAIFSEGLSRHGAAYFVELVQTASPANFSAFLAELYFEHVRQRDFADKPSRLQSLFAWEDLASAVEFMNGLGGDIYKVEPCGQFSRHDMNLIDATYDSEKMEKRAKLYWSGSPKEDVQSYAPRWEYLLKCPVKLLDRVLYPKR